MTWFINIGKWLLIWCDLLDVYIFISKLFEVNWKENSQKFMLRMISILKRSQNLNEYWNLTNWIRKFTCIIPNYIITRLTKTIQVLNM